MGKCGWLLVILNTRYKIQEVQSSVRHQGADPSWKVVLIATRRKDYQQKIISWFPVSLPLCNLMPKVPSLFSVSCTHPRAFGPCASLEEPRSSSLFPPYKLRRLTQPFVVLLSLFVSLIDATVIIITKSYDTIIILVANLTTNVSMFQRFDDVLQPAQTYVRESPVSSLPDVLFVEPRLLSHHPFHFSHSASGGYLGTNSLHSGKTTGIMLFIFHVICLETMTLAYIEV